MGYQNILELFNDQKLLDSLYGYAYARCNDRHTAEDLCSDIILTAMKSACNNPGIEHFHAFIWTIAKRVYADFCKKRRQTTDHMVMIPAEEMEIPMQTNPIEDFICDQEDLCRLDLVLNRISFLSKSYRDVMVRYYIDEYKIADISAMLQISETTVKQRLFSARNQIKKEAETVQSNMTLKPMDIAFIGTGNPVGNDPSVKAERILSKNVIYLCRKQALTAKEIAEKLNVPLPYVEDEIDIQLKGANGHYGLLRQAGKDRYLSNILILETPELKAGMQAYTRHLDDFCNGLKCMLETDRDKFTGFPFLSKQTDIRFILWTLISKAVWRLDGAVCDRLEKEYFTDIELVKREFTTIGFATRAGETLDVGFYGCDGFRDVIREYDVYGYSSVFVSNVYGSRLDKHFACEHHVLTDPLLLITLRAIGGLSVDSLTDDEKETAAKAIECGYLRKEDDTLLPKIIVISEDDEKAFYELLSGMDGIIESLSKTIACELSKLIKRYVPKHLINEYPLYSMASSIRILHDTIEICIAKNLLTVPKSRLCAEGVLMMVK